MKRIKFCPCCKQYKDIKDFGRDKSTKTKLNVYCHNCASLKSSHYQKTERGRLITNKREKQKRKDNPLTIREKFKLLKRKYNATAAGKYWNVRARAHKNDIAFSMSQKEFEVWFKTQELKCHYCKCDLVFGIGKYGGNLLTTLTIDRKNNKEGYLLNNMVLACRRCNTIKGGWFSEKQMLEIAYKYLTFEENQYA